MSLPKGVSNHLRPFQVLRPVRVFTPLLLIPQQYASMRMISLALPWLRFTSSSRLVPAVVICTLGLDLCQGRLAQRFLLTASWGLQQGATRPRMLSGLLSTNQQIGEGKGLVSAEMQGCSQMLSDPLVLPSAAFWPAWGKWASPWGSVRAGVQTNMVLDLLYLGSSDTLLKVCPQCAKFGHHSDLLFGSRRFPFIICDESHALKDPKTERTKFVVPLMKRARRALLLSGTPALSRPIELHPQVI